MVRKKREKVFSQCEPLRPLSTLCGVDFTAVDLLCLRGSVSTCLCFCLRLPNRDLIKKLLVVDRTRRLGNMKVSVSVRTCEVVFVISACHLTSHPSAKAEHSYSVIGQILNLGFWGLQNQTGSTPHLLVSPKEPVTQQ